MIYFVWPVLLILLYSFQTTWFEISRGLEVAPDLLLLFVIYFAMKNEVKKSVLVGVLLGIFRDVLALSFFGYHALINFVISLVIGNLKDTMYKSTFVPYLIVVAVVTAISKIIYLIIILVSVQGQITLLGFFFRQFPVAIILNLIFAIPCYALFKVIDNLNERYLEAKGDNYEEVFLEKSKMKKSDYK